MIPDCVGKPYGHVFDEVLHRHPDISRDRVLMVGDTIHTDVLGGLAAGIKTMLNSARELGEKQAAKAADGKEDARGD